MNKSTLAWLRDGNITQPEPQQYSFVLTFGIKGQTTYEERLNLRDKILHKLKDDQDLLSENFNYISDMSIKAL